MCVLRSARSSTVTVTSRLALTARALAVDVPHGLVANTFHRALGLNRQLLQRRSPPALPRRQSRAKLDVRRSAPHVPRLVEIGQVGAAAVEQLVREAVFELEDLDRVEPAEAGGGRVRKARGWEAK